MTTQYLQIDLPDVVYQRLQERAHQMHQSIQETARSVMVEALTQADQLPVDLENLLASLQQLSDTELWLTAHSQMPTHHSTQLERLNRKRQREGLTIAEEQKATVLLKQYQRTILVRAQAAVLLAQRGHDLTPLLTQP